MFPLTKLFVVFFIALFWSYEGNAQDQEDAILLGDVKALTLTKGQYTSYRRGPAIPQLQCVGGSAGCSKTPDVVQCTNVGFNGTDYQWECKADLYKKHRFGSIVVSCEGYNHPQDPYILRGSCGLKYVLERTDNLDLISCLIVIIILIGIMAVICWLQCLIGSGNNEPHKSYYHYDSFDFSSFDSSDDTTTAIGFGGTEER